MFAFAPLADRPTMYRNPTLTYRNQSMGDIITRVMTHARLPARVGEPHAVGVHLLYRVRDSRFRATFHTLDGPHRVDFMVTDQGVRLLDDMWMAGPPVEEGDALCLW